MSRVPFTGVAGFFFRAVFRRAGHEARFLRPACFTGTEGPWQVEMFYLTRWDVPQLLPHIPELPGCAADGKTYKEALANVEIIIQEWLETAKQLGRPIPAPRRHIFLPGIFDYSEKVSSGGG